MEVCLWAELGKVGKEQFWLLTDLEIHHFIWSTNSGIEHHILQCISGGFYVINTKLQCLEQEMHFRIDVFHMD